MEGYTEGRVIPPYYPRKKQIGGRNKNEEINNNNGCICHERANGFHGKRID